MLTGPASHSHSLFDPFYSTSGQQAPGQPLFYGLLPRLDIQAKTLPGGQSTQDLRSGDTAWRQGCELQKELKCKGKGLIFSSTILERSLAPKTLLTFPRGAQEDFPKMTAHLSVLN